MAERSEAAPESLDRYDYLLPQAAIAQQPNPVRDASRMLVLDPRGGLLDRAVQDLPPLLRPGDCLVVNDTRVRAARLLGAVAGREAEVLLVREVGAGRFLALVRPGRLLHVGRQAIGDGWRAEVVETWDEHPGG